MLWVHVDLHQFVLDCLHACTKDLCTGQWHYSQTGTQAGTSTHPCCMLVVSWLQTSYFLIQPWSQLDCSLSLYWFWPQALWECVFISFLLSKVDQSCVVFWSLNLWIQNEHRSTELLETVMWLSDTSSYEWVWASDGGSDEQQHPSRAAVHHICLNPSVKRKKFSFFLFNIKTHKDFIAPSAKKCYIIQVETLILIRFRLCWNIFVFLLCGHQQSNLVSEEMHLSCKWKQIIPVVIKTCTIII